ncbi:tetratricopeptide (TPR) repeat protein [Rhizobium ruizarguesonis]
MSGRSGSRIAIERSRAGRDIIAKEGLDEAETVELFTKLYKREADEAFVRSLHSYMTSLSRYSDRSYQLGDFTSANLASTIYVPVRGRILGDVQEGKVESVIASCLKMGQSAVLLQGKPGSGKSTILREAARYAWSKPARLGLEGRHIALPIRLRSYADLDGGSRAERIWSAIGKAWELGLPAEPPPPGFLDRWPELAHAPLLYLLDGLDEVSDARKHEVLMWLLDLAKGGEKILLTCRPGTLTNEVEEAFDALYRSVELLPFDATQQGMLAREWFSGKADDFLTEYRAVTTGELAGTPLMLTIAAGVFAAEGALPFRRSELYRTFIDMLWREGIKRSKPEEMGPDVYSYADTTVPECLCQIALSMSERMEGEISANFGTEPQAMTDLIAKVLLKNPLFTEAMADQRAEQMYRFLGSRSGVLHSTSDEVEWVHPTFREYLAAAALMEEHSRSRIEPILGKVYSPTWRQIILFLLAIGSERGPVDWLIEKIVSAGSPFSTSLAGIALAEGANVDPALAMRILDALRDKVREVSAGGRCERYLLSHGASVGSLLECVVMLENYPGAGSIIQSIKLDLENLAISYEGSDSAALEDLRQIKAVDSIKRLAVGESVPFEVRIAAANSLYTLGQADDGRVSALEVAHVASKDLSLWQRLASGLASAGGGDLLLVFATDPSMRDDRWAVMLDAIHEDDRERTLKELLEAPDILATKKLAVQLRVGMNAADALALLQGFSNSASLSWACLDAVVKNDDRDALLKVVEDQSFPSLAQIIALKLLRRLEDKPRLVKVLNSETVKLRLKRRAAEALYFCESLDADEAGVLLSFFDGVRNDKRPNHLLKRAFLNYLLFNSESAIHLLEQLFLLRNPDGWELEVYAHCLQRQGRYDEALEKYSEANALRPDLIFSKCRCAELLYAKNRIPEAAEIVGSLWSNEKTQWFRREAFEILRRAGRPEEAKTWARRLDDDPSSVAQEKFDYAEIALDKGYTRTAIRSFRELVDDEHLVGQGVGYLLGVALRIAGQLEEASDRFAYLIRPDADEWSPYAEGDLIDVLLRMRRFDEASELVAALRTEAPDEPFSLYLEGLLAGLQNDRTVLRHAASKARSILREACDGSDPIVMSNDMLCSLAMGDVESAQSLMSRLIQEFHYNQLRYYTIPYLETLAGAVEDRPALQSLEEQAAHFAWPEGKDADSPDRLREAALRVISRKPYPFPMYCQLNWIPGLWDDESLGTKILRHTTGDVKTIVLWTLGRPDRVYGQCNFKKDRQGEANLKFCDETQTVLRTNLDILVREMGARCLLFLEDDLRRQFEFVAYRIRSGVECQMADVDDI